MRGVIVCAPMRSARAGMAWALVAAATLRAPDARSQTDQELAAARRLFAEAVADEDAKRYELACEKFRRVAAVRETANVRYRIATCTEATGHLAEALRAYEAAVRLAQGDKPSADTARAASERAARLDRKVPRLTLVLPPDAPRAADVRVDDVPVPVDVLREPIALDAGHHSIAATAPDRAPFRTGVTLAESGRVTITIALDPLPSTTPASTSTATVPSTPIGTAPAPSRSTPAGAYVALGLGGALAVGSVVSLLVFESNLHKMDSDCALPAGSGKVGCPTTAAKTDADSAASSAKTDRVLAVGFAGGAVIALGVGAWLLASSTATEASKQGVRFVPVLSRDSAMLVVSGPLRR